MPANGEGDCASDISATFLSRIIAGGCGHAASSMSRLADRNGLSAQRRAKTGDKITVVEAGATHRSIQGTAIGDFTEAYDFTHFSLVATILAQKFYPGEKSGTGILIATFGTMTAGFVVRPLGGFIFGPLATVSDGSPGS